jgi:hypothetical protein
MERYSKSQLIEDRPRLVDFGFGLDYEEGVGVGAAGGAEFLAGFVEGIG